MGVLNASPDSFSDAGQYPTITSRLQRARDMTADGARVLDIGGETASPSRPQLAASDEVRRVVPLIEAIAAELDVLVSVDTYKLPVARAAIRAGASIVNDISGLADVELAKLCARTGTALVIMHNRGVPKQRLLDHGLYADVVGDVEAFLAERMSLANRAGLSNDQIILDPGPDFSKTPAQTVAVLRALERLHRLERPILLPISRKDFIGAITHRPPRQRLAGTLAAVDDGLRRGAHIFRVHDVAEVREYIDVRLALSSDRD